MKMQYLPHTIIAMLLVVGPGAIAWWVMQPEATNANTTVAEAEAVIAPAPATIQPAEAPAPTRSPSTAPARETTRTSKSAETAAVTLLEAQNRPHTLAQLSVAQRMPPEMPAPAEPPAAEAPAPVAAKPELRATTYNAGNKDVTPPTVVSMPWLNPPPPDSEPYDAAIQVVVNEQGTVDSVRATIAPRTIGESIWVTNALSAIKAWRFQPAVKDRLPVRYRLIVPLHTGK